MNTYLSLITYCINRCPYGYRCRYMGAHIDENKKLIVNEELVKKNPVYTVNGISEKTRKELLQKKVFYHDHVFNITAIF